MTIQSIRRRFQKVVFAGFLLGGSAFDLAGCFQSGFEEYANQQECLEKYGHKPDFVEMMCFD